MQLRAYAKINLGLRIIRKRPDGFHDIETVFHRIDLHDELILAPSPELALLSDSAAAPGGESNLCHRAAAVLRERLGFRGGVSIQLKKRIPVGAGCGGGSSDAAALLLGLPRFWGVEAPEGTLFDIARELGSDVPYFLRTGSAAAAGRGDVCEHFLLDLPFTILLCNPGTPVPTAWAYSRIVPSSNPSRRPLRRIIAEGLANPDVLRRELLNDFEEAVFPHYPEIRKIKERMIAAGAAYASMSGSGSSLFGFFPDPAPAQTLAEEFQKAGYRTAVTPPHFQIPSQ